MLCAVRASIREQNFGRIEVLIVADLRMEGSEAPANV
jgi:hypothetical protein